MPIPHTFILIKGQPKALQIESFRQEDYGAYTVKFKTSARTYHYKSCDVVWLKDSVRHDHLLNKVFIGGQEQKNVADIYSFAQGPKTHWRIIYSNGYAQDYLDGSITLLESCLADDVARKSFEYLKEVAKINELGKDEDHGGILSNLYDKVDFIDSAQAAAPYLNNTKYKVHKSKSPSLIYPFGCNSSQEKAVTAAFENQISIIQGPPGTGKTQTILNIIANIILEGKTVIVVSNNNSATANVLEKLQKYNLGFIVAALGKRENKERFLENQPVVPQELQSWNLDKTDGADPKEDIKAILEKLKISFNLQEELALLKQEYKNIEIEWEHYKQDNKISDDTYTAKSGIRSSRLMNLWLHYQAYAEGDIIGPKGFLGRLKERIKWSWMNFIRKYLLGIKAPFDTKNLKPIIMELQSLFYIVRLEEFRNRITEVEGELKLLEAKKLSESLTSLSMDILKDCLYEKYNGKERTVFSDLRDLSVSSDVVCQQYPVILSTTFSARKALYNTVYDYIIMDEASQVSVETGALALTCAKNAVIVGDALQLPNVVKEEDKLKLNAIFEKYQVNQGLDSAKFSFLKSICTVIPSVKQTLLREHYRCHPKIINFCNQKFYGGNLLIMTEDKGEENVISVIKTVPGEHTRGNYNQREIDVVSKEVLPKFSDDDEVGIITPYNDQVKAFNYQISTRETATIHKYQGREMDNIIMSVVDDQIKEFTDNPNLLNVAISRAKKHFSLVVTGNEGAVKDNISDLIDYIEYNNFEMTESKICSIFDYLYSHYTAQRIAFLSDKAQISEYDSENLTYALIETILSDTPMFNHLGILCHTPVRNVIRDSSLMNDNERNYVSNYSTHLDFVIVNHVTKKAVLAIETDGYNFHKEGTEQYQRDLMKDHVLEIYGLPLLRLKTTDSGEKDKIINKLNSILGNSQK